MSLTPGSRLGPYEVTAPIGEGGMGQVYRARDTKLNRDVALKILPDAFAGDPDRMARFTREAQTLAALNHSNIAHIHGLEESGGVRALVMEFVEGEDLSLRIARGAIPLAEALPIARQIVEALEAAHEQGIVHRDLKPANIKVRDDGTVKVLDFGLAKAMDPASGVGLQASAGVTNSPTLTTPAMTLAGMILGTAAYMSPEQARGKAVDRRADIWAFGAVVYEMLTGLRAFDGEDMTEVLGAVVRLEANFDALPSDVPARVRRVLELCLKKDVRQRAQAMGDVRLALEGAFETAAAQAGAPRPARSQSARVAWIVAAAVGIVAVAVGVIAARHLRETPPEPRVVNTTVLPPEGGEFAFATPYGLPAISPDATRIVFGARVNGKVQLWLRRMDSPTAQPLPGTDDASTPFWSPDSRWVGFGQISKLKKIDVQGGPPVTITDLSAPLRGASWSPQGVIVFSVSAPGPILRVAAEGGTAGPAIALEKGKEGLSQRNPWFLPDGRHFLYIVPIDGDMPASVGSLDEPGTPGKVVAQVHSPVAYAQGHLLYLRETTLMAQPFDLDQLKTTGEAVPVAERVPTYSTPSRMPGFAVSASGLLAYATGMSGAGSRLVWKDRQGKVIGNIGEPTGQIGNVEISPDGKRVAASIADRLGPEDIWIYDTARGIPTRFTFDPTNDRSPVWSPDGTTMYFASTRKGPADLFRKPSNGTTAEELIFGDSASKTPTSVSPDGRQLIYSRTEGAGNDLWVVPLAAGPNGATPEARAFLRTPFNELRAQFSPDGQWVAYSSDESGQAQQIYATPFSGPGGKRQISSGGGSFPRWRRDGKEIFYITADGQLMAVQVAARNGTLEVGAVQKLFDGLVGTRGTTYDVSPDGQKFLVVDNGAGSSPLTLVQNWTSALRR